MTIDEQWVKEHGSRRLRLALELGLLDRCRGAYRDERVAAYVPGYRFGHLLGKEAKREREADLREADGVRLVTLRFVEPWNPPLEALEALSQALDREEPVTLEALWTGPREGVTFVLVMECDVPGLGRCIIYRPAVWG